jgi:tetratricopeptide (TPR) repeat protein
MLRLAVLLAIGAASAAPAQLAVTQPTERLLLLPLSVTTPADSATSITVMDAVRERVAQLARYKVIVIPKAKICEALTASGFTCDILLDDRGASDLARFLTAQSYNRGSLTRNGGVLSADVRIISGSSGFGASFTVSGAPGVGPGSLVEAMAQRLNTIIRAAEYARSCTDQRSKGQYQRALDEARKALAIEPNLVSAHLCVATVYEAQRFGPDSIIAAAQRALKGDPKNTQALNLIANGYLQKGDTLRWLDALSSLARGDIKNIRTVLGVSQLLTQNKQAPKAVALIDDALAASPGEPQLMASKKRICIQNELWRCVLDVLGQELKSDTMVGRDTATLRLAIGAAQALADTQSYLKWTGVAVHNFPTSATYWKQRGAAWELAGKPDSAVVAYVKSLAIDPSDMTGTLLVAKALVDNANYDTVAVRNCRGDTSCVRQLRDHLIARLDTAKTYLDRAVSSPDTVARVNAAALMRSAGEKLVRAGVPEVAYQWLDRTLQVLAPRSPADTNGVRQLIRVNTSFWFGLASVSGLSKLYQDVVKSKNCDQAKAFYDRLQRTKQALQLGRSVHPPTADNLLNNVLPKFDAPIKSVKDSFKCKNF